MKKRGSPDSFIQSQDENWNYRVKNVDPYGLKLYRLQHNKFIDLGLLKKIILTFHTMKEAEKIQYAS